MQALQPRVKELQAKYANDPERLQVRQRSPGGRALRVFACLGSS